MDKPWKDESMTNPPSPEQVNVPVGEPVSTRRQETRAKLLEAAAEVFVEAGLQGASVEAVCSRAGFTRGAFYSNFANKEELFLAALAREYERRTELIAERGRVVEPQLRDLQGGLTREDTARFVSEVISPSSNELRWFALETEFLLLAMRDPSLSVGFAEFLTGFIDGLAPFVEHLIGAAGRRFTLPIEHALPLLSGVYERALRVTAVSGPTAPGGTDEASDRIAELLFAITDES